MFKGEVDVQGWEGHYTTICRACYSIQMFLKCCLVWCGAVESFNTCFILASSVSTALRRRQSSELLLSYGCVINRA